jgi:hypothetical protein
LVENELHDKITELLESLELSMERRKKCPNFNHGRPNAPVRFCPVCGLWRTIYLIKMTLVMLAAGKQSMYIWIPSK